MDFCVAITTYNRSNLLSRAIRSVFAQTWRGLEVLVIDDASTDGTAEMMGHSYPQVRYVRQEQNQGICAARNRGLREATRPWVLFLDDDDTLFPEALARIATRVKELPDFTTYPVFQFPRSMTRVGQRFLIARLRHFLDGTIRGDFGYLFQRDLCLKENLIFDEFHGGEGLLFWRIAERFGVPTWNEPVQELHRDALCRMTSTEFLMRHARDKAAQDERFLVEFGAFMSSEFPSQYRRRVLSAATYRLLAGDRSLSRAHLSVCFQSHVSIAAAALWVLSFLPRTWARNFFSAYKSRVDGWSL